MGTASVASFAIAGGVELNATAPRAPAPPAVVAVALFLILRPSLPRHFLRRRRLGLRLFPLTLLFLASTVLQDTEKPQATTGPSGQPCICYSLR